MESFAVLWLESGILHLDQSLIPGWNLQELGSKGCPGGESTPEKTDM